MFESFFFAKHLTTVEHIVTYINLTKNVVKSCCKLILLLESLHCFSTGIIISEMRRNRAGRRCGS